MSDTKYHTSFKGDNWLLPQAKPQMLCFCFPPISEDIGELLLKMFILTAIDRMWKQEGFSAPATSSFFHRVNFPLNKLVSINDPLRNSNCEMNSEQTIGL